MLKWGGRRRGSGRKRKHSKGVAHRTREYVSLRTPLHVNFKYRTVIRNKARLKILKRAIENARGYGLRILQYSLQKNHVHLIIEADNNGILTKGMRSLTITMAKGIDMGRIQLERYHLHVLRTRKEAKNAVHYVLFNEQKHEKGTCSTVDDYSSLFNMSNVVELIKEFTQRKRLTIRLGRGERWLPDLPGSPLVPAHLKAFRCAGTS